MHERILRSNVRLATRGVAPAVRDGLKYGMPIILAIETSSELASCALLNSGDTARRLP
jgi:hypothetical protein